MSEPFIGTCDSCHFEDIPVKNYNTSRFAEKELRENKFCVICSNTLISNHVTYPGQYPNWLGDIAYCVNAIIQEIRKSRDG